MSHCAEIIPLMRLPRKLGVFDYVVASALERDIKVGQIVLVPFRKSLVYGVVVALKNKSLHPERLLKVIHSLVEKDVIVRRAQFRLIFWMSKYYFQSPALIARAILPKFPQRIRKKTEISHTNQRIFHAVHKAEVQYIIQSKKKKLLLLSKTNHQLYQELALEFAKRKKQTLIIVPEIELTKSVIQNYINIFGNDTVAVLHSKITKTKLYYSYKNIFQNRVAVILGTRIAIFAPLVKPGIIIIDSEHDQSLKQYDQNPRYHVREVAFEIMKNTQSKLLLVSPCPKVATYYHFKRSMITPQKTASEFCQAILVDMKEERRAGNFSLFSEVAHEALKKVEEDKRQAIIFVNRKGTARYVRCKDCDFLPRCEQCALPFHYYAQKAVSVAELYCQRCHTQATIPPFCPDCKGVEFRFIGVGTRKVFEEVQRILPRSSASVMDSDVSPSLRKDIVEQLKAGTITFLIASSVIFSHCKVAAADTVIVLSADQLLGIPDAFADEQAFELLVCAKNLARKQYIVQTYNTNNTVIRSAIQDGYKKYYASELAARKTFGYPPFGNLIKLIVQDVDQKKAKNTAIGLANRLRTFVIQNKMRNIEILGPLPSLNVRVRRFFRFYVVLKLLKSYVQSDLDTMMSLMPDSALIDVDPQSLI